MRAVMRLVLGGAVLVALAGGTTACTLGCPTGLATGVLVADGADLALRSDSGNVHAVAWPQGTSVRRDGAIFVLSDVLGNVKAREGDRVNIGGGALDDGRIGACGEVEVVAHASG